MPAHVETAGSSPVLLPRDEACRLRIAHVVSSLTVGGMEWFVTRLAGHQQAAGHAVAVLAIRGGELLEEARQRSLTVIVPQGRRVRRLLHSTQALAAFRPDVIHAHNPASLHYAASAKFVTRARLVMTDHNQGHGQTRVPSRWERRSVDAVVAVSQHTARSPIVPEFGVKTVVIHNGVESAAASAMSALDCEALRRSMNLLGRFVGVMPASLQPVKGHRVLLETLALLRANGHAPVTVLLAGDGPEGQALRSYARDLCLTGQDVRFLGYRSDVAQLLRVADFMVLPSLTEGLPLSLLEAMSQGTAVVASAVGGIPEVITDGSTGLLVPPSDPIRLAAAIERLHSSRELRAELACNARTLACTQFSFERMTARYHDLYHQLMSAT
jgi:glycosyltransferase involved in cell wall biosynthesis